MEALLEFIADDRYGWVWLLVSGTLGFPAWAWTTTTRKTSLGAWNLSTSAAAPSLAGHVSAVVGLLGFAPLAIFSALNWMSEYMTWPQFGVNIGAWAIGAIVGVGAGTTLGLVTAERELRRFAASLRNS